MAEKLREAIEWARDAGRGLTTCYLEMPQKLLLLANAAERSLTVDDLKREVDELRERVAHLQREADDAVRNQDTLAKALAVDDAEVREAVARVRKLMEQIVDHGDSMCGSPVLFGEDKKAFDVLIAAALAPRTRWYTPEVDGVPTDTSRHLVARWEDGDTTLANPPWIPLNGRDDAMRAYTYLDPPPVEEPLPTCAVCSDVARIGFHQNGKYQWCGCPQHGWACGKTKAEARDNWRKMRGHA